MSSVDKEQELASLRERVGRLEEEVAESKAAAPWQPQSFYTAYYATTGFLLGFFGAAVSLLVNLIGAPLAGKSPFELIRIYLTFPLGEQALKLMTVDGQKVYVVEDNFILACGCCLYLLTGMFLGVPFFVALARICGDGSVWKRLAVASVLSLILWAIVFYGILSWLQPALFGGNWITDTSLLPAWVAAVTHLIFGWTLALAYPLGQFHPYKGVVEK